MSLISRIQSFVSGNGMKARAIRGTALSVISFGGSQFIRLVSNLILTRILFPEAFGLMALVQVLLIGLDNFSDLGIGPAIIQSKRGNQASFLNTAWTVQIIRGVLLWVAACALARPVAQFYDQPELVQIIPVLSLVTILTGFSSTRIFLATRNLSLGRVTAMELGSQLLGTVAMILAALWLRSIWALVVGSIGIALVRMALSHALISGPRNRLHWDKDAFSEIFHFGKYIFIGTIAGYFIQQGDRLVLGRYIALEELAIFTIAQMFATLPLMMSYQLVERVLLPLYRNRPPLDDEANWYMVGRARGLLIVGFLAITALFAFGGDLLVVFLYDERYHLAGPYLVLLSISIIPRLIAGAYGFVLIANGNSRDYTILTSGSAFFRMGALVLGIQNFGILGAIFAPVLVDFLTYPFQIYYVRRYKGWYGLYDIGLLVLGVAISVVALWLNPAALEILMHVGSGN